jgi:hypothetical protein
MIKNDKATDILKKQNGRHKQSKQSSGQHTPARPKNISFSVHVN